MLISLIFTEISEDMAKDGGEGEEGEECWDIASHFFVTIFLCRHCFVATFVGSRLVSLI